VKSTVFIPCVWLSLSLSIPAPAADAWNPQSAAHYLDTREMWWQTWPAAQRDQGTSCVSCHSVVSYALARPALRRELGEQTLSAPERTMLEYVRKRVGLWYEVQPFYKSSLTALNKSAESRGTEAVLNALILASYDKGNGRLEDITRAAFDAMWTLQVTWGPKSGAWDWLNFHLSPWEADESQYWGAAMAAVAVGTPDHYRDDPKIQKGLDSLRSYLRRDYAEQPLVNKLTLLWASTRLPGLLTEAERVALIAPVLAKENADGGWSLGGLGRYKRHDGSPLETRSDGYATGLTVLAFEEAGLAGKQPAFQKAVDWLAGSQDKDQGLWPAWSVNEQRDPASGIGRFMSDAATAWAVMALEDSR
jgi:squalene-hopene/tetraprenyl-beta-curcumene cyclase